MPGLVPGIHVFAMLRFAWMVGASPAMASSWFTMAERLKQSGPNLFAAAGLEQDAPRPLP